MRDCELTAVATHELLHPLLSIAFHRFGNDPTSMKALIAHRKLRLRRLKEAKRAKAYPLGPRTGSWTRSFGSDPETMLVDGGRGNGYSLKEKQVQI